MDPTTGAPDASDKLRRMRRWLLEEVELQQAASNLARQQQIARILDASYPGTLPQVSSVSPALPYWRAVGKLEPGPVVRGPGCLDVLAYVRITLSLSNSPLSMNFTLDPNTLEEPFRECVRSKFCAIAKMGQ